jgi:transposase InsO family protein
MVIWTDDGGGLSKLPLDFVRHPAFLPCLPVLSENYIRPGFASGGRIIASLRAMFAILHALGTLLVDLFKSRSRLGAENLFLRHQLTIALRRAPPRRRLRDSDRALLTWMTRLWPNLLDMAQVVQPETILRWHRAGFKVFWRWKSRNRVGRPKIDRGLRDLIERMSRENPLWGASRIHGELLMLGFEVAQSTVSKYMVRGGTPPSQSWKTFLRNHAEAIAAIDMCVVPTMTFDLLFAFLVLGHARRQLLWFEVTRHPTAEWLARQITEAFPWASAPAYLVRDNDRAYGNVFTSRVRAMGIRDRPISPGSPWQNGIAERLIGTLRRECLDRMLIFGESHLRRVLASYTAYYNQARTHLALQKDAPLHRAVQRSGVIVAIPILGELHHQYVRI